MSKKKSIRFNDSDLKKILRSNSPFAAKEAYNSVRTNIMFTDNGENCPTYIITSALPNDGKSINCVNIALSFAMVGKRTLIIDMDLRNPTIHRLFKLPQEHGLSELLAGIERNDNFQPTGIDNLSVLTAGRTPPNPAELLSGERTAHLLARARERFDYIFIDMPPVEVVADASIVAKHATGLLLVVKSGSTDIAVLRHCCGVLKQVNANIVGFLLNDFNPKAQSYGRRYRYSYKYYKDYSDYDTVPHTEK